MSIESGGPSPEEMGISVEGEPEEPPIELSKAEFDLLQDGPLETKNNFLAEKGIQRDTGPRRISVEGQELTMNTNSEDFGTLMVERDVQRQE